MKQIMKSPIGTQRQNFTLPTISVASSESIDPQLTLNDDNIPPQNFETKDSIGSSFIWSNMEKFMEWTYDQVQEVSSEKKTLKEENAFQATVMKYLNTNLAKIWEEFGKSNIQLNSILEGQQTMRKDSRNF
ncbi:hypothetical protein O181_027801 [Austropuccinia psidii MF-1]|uniref:Uncharacterized protein n=1 Tax=Austropuccinia psidii MF-1 TaxID=1389203 RepID=A0A9Q3CMZ7_9BASI|nr:hypothetical protein [Austropuccinia psidii MF-1]